ncbi:unnamed protein product [Gadus morhua 'NCC']
MPEHQNNGHRAPWRGGKPTHPAIWPATDRGDNTPRKAQGKGHLGAGGAWHGSGPQRRQNNGEQRGPHSRPLLAASFPFKRSLRLSLSLRATTAPPPPPPPPPPTTTTTPTTADTETTTSFRTPNMEKHAL